MDQVQTVALGWKREVGGGIVGVGRVSLRFSFLKLTEFYPDSCWQVQEAMARLPYSIKCNAIFSCCATQAQILLIYIFK